MIDTTTPEYLAEEKRIANRPLKLVELLGITESQARDLIKTGFTDEEIVKEFRNQQKEMEALAGKELPTLAELEYIPETIAEVVIQRLEEKELEKVAPKTGFVGLDAKIKGFIPGHLYTLTGQTNIGKSSLACNFAYHVAKQGKKVLYLALEPDNTIVDYLASIAEKKWFDEVTPNDYKSIPEGIEIFKKDKVNTIEKMLKVLRKRSRYDLVIVDHVGYFITDSKNPYQLQSDVIKMLVSIAKEKKSAVMIIAHMRKGGIKKKSAIPTMDEISGSAALKQDATEVLIAIRTEDENDKFGLNYTNEGFILVAKTKAGKPGAVKVTYHDGGATINEKVEQWKPF